MRRHEPGAELARLHGRPDGEVGARDAGREAEVVLDAARRARLPTRADLVDDERREAFAGAVDRRREPRRPGPDDDEVEAFVGGGFGADADRAGEREVRRVVEDGLRSPEDDRPVDPLLRQAVGGEGGGGLVGVVLEVEPAGGQVVAAHELAEPHRVGVGARADEREARRAPGRDLAPGAEGGHEHAREVGVGGEDAAKRVGGDAQQAPVRDHPRGGEDALAEKQARLAEKLPRLERLGHDGALARGVLEDLRRAREDDEEVVGGVALAEQERARRGVLLGAEGAEAREVCGGEDREGGGRRHRGGEARNGPNGTRSGRVRGKDGTP